MHTRKSKLISDTDGWQTVRSEAIFESDHLDLTRQEVLTPTRGQKPVKWTVVHRPPAVVVAPVTRDGKYLLIRQERIPVRATLWEFPAGQIDEEDAGDESVIRETVVRELREETGYELPTDGGGELIALGHLFSSQGFTDEYCHLFLARGVIPTATGPSNQGDERIVECREFTGPELTRMIAEGEISDANALGVFARLHARGMFPAS